MTRCLIIIAAFFCLKGVVAQDMPANIFDASRNGDIELMISIIESDPESVNSVNENGHSPLILASYHDRSEAVRLLISSGADVDYEFSQGSAIHGVAFKGYTEIAKILISEGIDINKPDKNGSTPLIYAVLFNHIDLAILLFENGADVNHKDNTGSSALDYASSLSIPELTELFNSVLNTDQ